MILVQLSTMPRQRQRIRVRRRWQQQRPVWPPRYGMGRPGVRLPPAAGGQSTVRDLQHLEALVSTWDAPPPPPAVSPVRRSPRRSTLPGRVIMQHTLAHWLQRQDVEIMVYREYIRWVALPYWLVPQATRGEATRQTVVLLVAQDHPWTPEETQRLRQQVTYGALRRTLAFQELVQEVDGPVQFCDTLWPGRAVQRLRVGWTADRGWYWFPPSRGGHRLGAHWSRERVMETLEHVSVVHQTSVARPPVDWPRFLHDAWAQLWDANEGPEQLVRMRDYQDPDALDDFLSRLDRHDDVSLRTVIRTFAIPELFFGTAITYLGTFVLFLFLSLPWGPRSPFVPTGLLAHVLGWAGLGVSGLATLLPFVMAPLSRMDIRRWLTDLVL